MTLYSIFSLVLVVAAGFAYLNHRLLRLPPTIGLLVLALLSSLALLLLSRLVSVSIPLSFLRSRREFTRFNVAVLTWGGLRGGLSVALALSLPPTVPRELLVGITYVVVVFSILG